VRRRWLPAITRLHHRQQPLRHREELPLIFPGARIHPWRPIEKPLTGKVADAVEHVVRQLLADPWHTVSFREVMSHIGIKDGKDFRQRIRRHRDFINALAAQGIEEWRSGKYPRGFGYVGGVAAPDH
jgi:hypothetical protein